MKETQERRVSDHPQRPRIHYIERRFAGERTLEMALTSLIKAHS